MGKSEKTGNVAAAGIHSTATTKPTTSTATTKTATVKTTTTGSKSSGSGKSAGSGAAGVTQMNTPSIGEQLYSTYGNGVSGNTFDASAAARTAQTIVNNARASVPAANVSKVTPVDITEQRKQLADLTEQQKQQALRQIDYATQQGVNELQRIFEDTLPQYQTQRNQTAIDEAKTLDNQALYASRRGDSGGIGKAQYGAIQNTAATNRQAINSAQVKLYTDTSRQVADLQAQGEFDKADKVLSISQDYTEKLMDLEKWAKEKNIGIDEFNSRLDQWKADYDLNVNRYLTDTEISAAKATGAFPSGAATAEQYNSTADRYAAAGKNMISAGIIPSEEQLAAMGWTPEQYWVYKMSSAAQS